MLVFLTNRRRIGAELTATLAKAGMTVQLAFTDAADGLCRIRTVGTVLVDGVPDPAAATKLCAHLHEEYPNLPLILLGAPSVVLDTVADCILRSTDVSELAEDILQFCRSRGWQPDFSTYTLLVTQDPDATQLLGYRMALSPHEHALLRLICLRAPDTVSQSELLDVCFPRGKQGLSDLSVYISRINAKSRKIGGLPIVVSEYGKGYRLRDGIL